MKSSSGVSLINLTIYIIAMVLVVAMVATINSFFYTNIQGIDENSENIAEISKFNMYFLEDIQTNANKVIRISDTKDSISFSSGNTYYIENNEIYFNTIPICKNITNLQFAKEEKDNKQIITVLITIGEKMEYTKTTTYVISM